MSGLHLFFLDTTYASPKYTQHQKINKFEIQNLKPSLQNLHHWKWPFATKQTPWVCKIEWSAHPITSSKGGRSVASSLRGPEVRVLMMEASRLNSEPQRGVALDDAQLPPTNAPPPCGGSLGGRASVSNCRERSIRAVALLERRRCRQLAMCPVQAASKTPTDRRIVL